VQEISAGSLCAGCLMQSVTSLGLKRPPRLARSDAESSRRGRFSIPSTRRSFGRGPIFPLRPSSLRLPPAPFPRRPALCALRPAPLPLRPLALGLRPSSCPLLPCPLSGPAAAERPGARRARSGAPPEPPAVAPRRRGARPQQLRRHPWPLVTRRQPLVTRRQPLVMRP